MHACSQVSQGCPRVEDKLPIQKSPCVHAHRSARTPFCSQGPLQKTSRMVNMARHPWKRWGTGRRVWLGVERLLAKRCNLPRHMQGQANKGVLGRVWVILQQYFPLNQLSPLPLSAWQDKGWRSREWDGMQGAAWGACISSFSLPD